MSKVCELNLFLSPQRKARFLCTCFFTLGISEYKTLFNKYYLFLNAVICLLSHKIKVENRKQEHTHTHKHAESYLKIH